ncbi:DUF6691 family protein [Solimonas soli]|uniref:DUF6691 family protein n=1 Tax=Solimonas soli TaxID=413479 RepID=UPI0004889D41|nr:DUF6691 family protein [Solimonas soli]
MRLVPLVAGLLFGAGMLVSGMADPHKVLAFLDVTRAWDPSLAFVMAAALAIALPAFAYARRHPRTLIGAQPIVLPPRSPLTPQLLVGATLFGIGWGLSGLCPGPVLVVASGGSLGAIVFVLAMAIGMRLASRCAPRRASKRAPQASDGDAACG